MSFEYYYIKNNQQVGPVRLHQLLKDINGETLVWRAGIDWSKAREVDELKNYFHEVIKEVIIEKPVEVIKEVVVDKKDNEHPAPAKKNYTPLLLFVIIGVIAAVTAYFFLKDQEPLGPEKCKPIKSEFYRNVKKKGSITVGYLTIDHFDSEARDCLAKLVGDKPTKFKNKESFDELYRGLERGELDILLLNSKEKNEWARCLDFSDKFKIQNSTGYYYIGFPKENDNVLSKFNDCINK